MKRKKKQTRPGAKAHGFRKHLFSGLAILVPLGVTALVAKIVIEGVSGVLLPILNLIFEKVPDFVLVPVSILVFVVVVWLVGLMASYVIGRRIIGLGEAFISRVPLVKTVYTSSKQVVDLLVRDEGEAFDYVVLVDYPCPGLKAMGFVTGQVLGPDAAVFLKVFIPTTPNPTSGYLELVPPAKAVRLAISVEDAVKLIMSGGILAPDVLRARSVEEPEEETEKKASKLQNGPRNPSARRAGSGRRSKDTRT